MPYSAVRFARPTLRLAECARFYADVVGLPELAAFTGHDGYSGHVFGVPGHHVEIEVVQVDDATSIPRPDPENAIVLYVGPAEFGRLRERTHAERHDPANPYWTALGAFVIDDPEGWPVIVVPVGSAPVSIEPFDGDRRKLEWLFRLAEDSPTVLDGYIDHGHVWVARAADGAVVGHIQAVADGAEWEIVNTAVDESVQGQGIGRRIVEHVVGEAQSAGAARILLATATADIGNLRFYQKLGFRMAHVVPDAFSPATGYPDPIDIDGIPLRDQVWFAREL